MREEELLRQARLYGERMPEELTFGELAQVLVTPKDVDTLVTELAKVVGYGINACLQSGLSVSDMDYFLG